MIRKIFTIIFLVSTLHFSAVTAQSINTAKLDSLFDILNSKNKAMGSIAISANGKLVYQKAIGYTSINGDNKTPANIKTKYRIGSITKMFTATMILQLVEEGKLTIDTKLSKWFPQVANADKITIGEMLSHHSGLHNFTNDAAFANYMTKPQSEADMLAIIQKQPSDFEPDTKADYSNTNFVLLGYIVEKITGKRYADELKHRIIAKIGLTDTYYGGKINSANNEAYSYKFDNGWQLQPETDMSIPGAAGALVSTPADLTKFIEALFGGKLISQKSLDQMKTMKDNFGMAMFIMPFYDKIGYGHNGGIDGFSSVLSYFPEDKLAISYISNGVAYPMNDILLGVLKIYFNKPFQVPTFKTIITSSDQLDKYLGNYSTTQMPLKIVITKNNTTLVAQGTGQAAFELEAVEPDKFIYSAAGITLLFDPAKNEFTLLQGGQNILFTKDK